MKRKPPYGTLRLSEQPLVRADINLQPYVAARASAIKPGRVTLGFGHPRQSSVSVLMTPDEARRFAGLLQDAADAAEAAQASQEAAA